MLLIQQKNTPFHKVFKELLLRMELDCVDHELLLCRLQLHQYNLGFTDDVLRWMTSFISGRTQQVSYDGQLSPNRPLQFGVPQASVLGSLIFVL